MTVAVRAALERADVVVGYKYYFQFITPYLKPETECVDTGMKRERERAEQAFQLAEMGKDVVVISSGDAGIYGMVPLIYEMKRQQQSVVEIVTLPGISAFQKAAALLGAPMGHDFCVISLSDLMTPWEKIERRIKAAASADFVTAVYNPRSTERYWQLHRLKELFLKERAASTPVGYVRQAGREGQDVKVCTLGDFNPDDVDMFTIVVIGNSQSYLADQLFITPRGYYRAQSDQAAQSVGQEIMMESFRTIRSELRQPYVPTEHLWPLLHAIHTTADFSMEEILFTSPQAVPLIYAAMREKRLTTIVTDVTMAAAGIRKAACSRLGVTVKCYLHDERVAALANSQNITRTQAGIRLAVSEHPDALFVFGNAPTALMELCSLIRRQKAHPQGIIAAPVGFVHVCESKYMVKSFAAIPMIIVEGRKGGSNLAATLVNSILSWDDAQQLRPGRDV